MSLLEAAKTYLDPQTDQLAMTEFQDFCGLVQQNGKTIQATSGHNKQLYVWPFEEGRVRPRQTHEGTAIGQGCDNRSVLRHHVFLDP